MTRTIDMRVFFRMRYEDCHTCDNEHELITINSHSNGNVCPISNTYHIAWPTARTVEQISKGQRLQAAVLVNLAAPAGVAGETRTCCPDLLHLRCTLTDGHDSQRSCSKGCSDSGHHASVACCPVSRRASVPIPPCPCGAGSLSFLDSISAPSPACY